MRERNGRRATAAGVIAILLLITAPWSWRLIAVDDAPTRDRRHSLSAAYSLAEHGVLDYSLPGTGPEPREPAPGNHREPLFPLLWAGVIALDPGGEIDAHGWRCFQEPAPCPTTMRLTKAVNLALHSALTLAIGAGVWWITGRRRYAIAWMLLAAASPLLLTGVDTWETEIGANLFLLLHSLLLYGAFTSGRPMLAAAVGGIALGLLILVKAAFYYLLILYLIALALLLLAGLTGRALGRDMGTQIPWRPAITMTLCAVVVIAPWMVRNLVVLGEWSVSERGGRVLAIRSQYTTMPWSDYPAAFTFFTPDRGTRLLSERYDAETVARLYRRSPTSYYRTSQKGRGAADRLAAEQDISLTLAALTVMARNLDKQLALTPLFIYRGSAPPRYLSVDAYKRLPKPLRRFNEAMQRWWIPIMLAAAAWLALRGPRRFLLLTVPALFAVAFHAVLTHFIQRYATPLYGISMLVTAVVLHELARALARRLRQPSDVGEAR